MKAVIMAGGEGTRLRPLTCARPKPMVPVANKPLMEHIIALLKKYNITDIAVTLQYMPEKIKDYFLNGEDFGVNLRYYTENTPLGTAGSVKNAEEVLDDTFIVISGDSLTDVDLDQALAFHKNKKSMATLVLTKVNIPLEYGVVITNNTGKILRFVEKPDWSQVFSDTVNTGIYILDKSILSTFKKGVQYDFGKDLFPSLLADKVPMYGYITDKYWCDVGDIKPYIASHFHIMEGAVDIDIDCEKYDVQKKIWIGENVEIEEGAKLEGPLIIGNDCKIKRGAKIGPFSVIGDNCIIGEKSSIKKSVLFKGVKLENGCQIRGAVICSRVYIKDMTSVFENSVIGDDTILGENVKIKPEIKIWPEKNIEDSTYVTSNMVWGTKSVKNLFFGKGIAGEINVDINPEFASRLGTAFGSMQKKSSRIAVGYDGENSTVMLKKALEAGVMSSGCEVFDAGPCLLSVLRGSVKFFDCKGGIYLSLSSGDENLEITFLDNFGYNITKNNERKLENIFAREDFLRCESEDIKPVKDISEYSNFYYKNIINNYQIKNLPFCVVLHSTSSFVGKEVTRILTDAGIKVLSYISGPAELKEVENGIISRVRCNSVDMGISIDYSMEKIKIYDNLGRLISGDKYIALASLAFFEKNKGKPFQVPLSSSNAVDKIAENYGSYIIRTKTSQRDIIESMPGYMEEGPFPEGYKYYFDVLWTFLDIMDILNRKNISLADFIDLIPSFFMQTREVECIFENKGKVIRRIMEEEKSHKIETLEGVKIFKENGWVLVLPDSRRPVCKIVSEGFTNEIAEEMCGFYSDKIRAITAES